MGNVKCENVFKHVQSNVAIASNYQSWVSGKLPPRKIAPRSVSGFGLGLALELGPGTIFRGAIFLKP